MSDDDLQALKDWLRRSPEQELADVIDTAMHRHSIKKSRQPHVRRVVAEAFNIARERASH